MKAKRWGRKPRKESEDKQARRVQRLALKQKRDLGLFPSEYDVNKFIDEEEGK